MTNEYLSQALEECAARRVENQAEEARRLKIATDLCPEIAQLMKQRQEDIMEGLRKALEGIRHEGVVERTRARGERILQLLDQHQLPADYLDPIYQCLICQDSGYTDAIPRQLCSCVSTRYHSLLGGQQGQGDGPSFERFDLEIFPDSAMDERGVSQRQLMAVIKQHAERYADHLPGSPLILLLHGTSGLGKTYVLKSIAKRAIDQQKQALSYKANDLLNHIREAYFSREGDVAQPYYDVDLLLLDDLGTEPLWENITLEQLFALLEYRLEHKKHTVISTNLSPDNLTKRYTRRITSRLLDRSNSLVLHFQGQDVRLLAR